MKQEICQWRKNISGIQSRGFVFSAEYNNSEDP